MIYILFGPPGVGKGTQGERIAETLGVPTISTGAIFRGLAGAGTEVGRTAQEYMSQGKLVPDEVVVALVRERIVKDDCSQGFLLDGFPRTVNQAAVLEQMLKELGLQLTAVLDFEAAEDEIVSRLSGRRTCPGCGATYHVTNMPPRIEGVCDACGKDLVQRTDDQPDSILTRLREYQDKTSPVLGFYQERGLLKTIDAAAAPDAVFAVVKQIIGATPQA